MNPSNVYIFFIYYQGRDGDLLSESTSLVPDDVQPLDISNSLLVSLWLCGHRNLNGIFCRFFSSTSLYYTTLGDGSAGIIRS